MTEKSNVYVEVHLIVYKSTNFKSTFRLSAMTQQPLCLLSSLWALADNVGFLPVQGTSFPCFAVGKPP